MIGAVAIRYPRKSPPRVCPDNPAHRETLPLSAHHQHQEDQRHNAEALKRIRDRFSIPGPCAVFGRRLSSHLNAVAGLGHLDALGTG